MKVSGAVLQKLYKNSRFLRIRIFIAIKGIDIDRIDPSKYYDI